MYNDAKAFSHLKNDQAKITVSIENGTELPVRGIDTESSITIVNRKQEEVELKDVLLVPDLFCNLISVIQFRKNGAEMALDSDKNGRGIYIGQNSKNKVLCGIEDQVNGLFEAVIRVQKKEAHTSISNSNVESRLWNARMGHAAASTTSKNHTHRAQYPHQAI